MVSSSVAFAPFKSLRSPDGAAAFMNPANRRIETEQTLMAFSIRIAEAAVCLEQSVTQPPSSSSHLEPDSKGFVVSFIRREMRSH